MCTLRELQTTVRLYIEKVRTSEAEINLLKGDLAKKDETIAQLRSKINQFKTVARVMANDRDYDCSSDFCFVLPPSFSHPCMACYKEKAKPEDKVLSGQVNVNFELDSIGGSEDSLSDEAIDENSANALQKIAAKTATKHPQTMQNAQGKVLTSPLLLQLPPSSYLRTQTLSDQTENEAIKNEIKTSPKNTQSRFQRNGSFRKSKNSSDIRPRTKANKKSSKNKNYDFDLLKPGSTVPSPNLNDYERMDGSGDESKENTKIRKKSRPSVHNWLKKHAKWRNKASADENIDVESLTAAPASDYVENSLEIETDMRKKSLWKKGLSYVWPPKSSSPKPTTATSFGCDDPMSSQNGNVYNYQDQPALSSVAVQTPPLCADYSYQQNTQSCLYATHIEQAYLQRYRERMAYLEQFGAEHFVLANLQQAAVLEEQTRVARLNQCFFLKRLAESWKIKNKAESMECQATEKGSTDAMEIDPPSPANTESFTVNNETVPTTSPFDISSLTQNSQSIKDSNYIFKQCTFNPYNNKDNTPYPPPSVEKTNTNNFGGRKASPKRFNKIPQSLSLNRLGKCRRKTSRKYFSPKTSPTGDESSFGIFRKRFKRNAISGEPSSCNAIMGSTCFNKQQPYLIPKSQQ